MRRYEGRPFALLGVNAGVSREELRRVQGRAQLTWRSCWDGPRGPLAGQWGVEVFPTLFLLDHRGTIRFESRGVPDLDDLDRRVEWLVREATSRS